MSQRVGGMIPVGLTSRNFRFDGSDLAGFFTTPGGERWAFAACVKHVPVAKDEEAMIRIPGKALGEIASAG